MADTDALAIGQILYAIQGTALIRVPKGANTARFERITFTGSEKPPASPIANVHDSIDLGPFDEILSVRAVNRWGGGQEVVLVTKTGLSSIAMDGKVARLTKVSAKLQLPVLIIGFDPVQTTKRSLALVETDPTTKRISVVQVDLNSGDRDQPCVFPQTVSGTPVAVELVRRGAAMMLVMATIEHDSLRVHAVVWGALGPQIAKDAVVTMDLGPILANARVEVSTTVTNMRARSPDQQFAIAWADSDSTGKIALIGWEASGDPAKAPTALGATVLATAVPDPAFASVELPLFRLASAHLLHEDTEQLVLGYPARYGHVRGCAALMLFTLDEPEGGARTLKCESKYAASNVGGQPWASIDLHIGAGVFGTCMGVQIVGGGASMQDIAKGRALVLCGFVSVDPNDRSFPPMPAGAPGVPFICVGPDGPGNGLASLDLNAMRFLAIPSDLGGESVILGPPKRAPLSKCAQLLGIVQAPPFDRRTKDDMPSVGFAESKGKGSGGNLSNEAAWALSNHISSNLGLGPLTLSTSIHNSYLKSLSTMKDSSVSTTATFHESISDEDMVMILETAYTIWRYPVVRPAGTDQNGSDENKDNELLLIIPARAKSRTFWGPASDYGYRPRSEVGMLLSYVNVEKFGYSEENLLFEDIQGFAVSTRSNTSSINYDKTESVSISDSKHISVLNSVSTHAGLSEVFEYGSFGLNLENSKSFSDSKAETTHFTIHTSLSVSISSGTVTYLDYHYSMYPYFYVNPTLGCFVLGWEVETHGPGWQANGGNVALTAPQICLIRPITNSAFEINNRFSRSISFSPRKADGTMTITIEIFNNSMSVAENVECEFFNVSAAFASASPSLPSIKKLTDAAYEIKNSRKSLEGVLNPLQRRTISMTDKFTEKVVYIAVQLYMDTIPSGVYWAVYPQDTLKVT